MLAAVFCGLTLGLNLNGCVDEKFKALERKSHEMDLHLLVESFKELFLLLVDSINVIGSIAGKLSELVKVLQNNFGTLLNLTEIVPHPFQKSSGDKGLAETVLEIIPRQDLIGRQMGLSGFPPSTSLAGQVVGGKQDLLVVGHSSDFKIILDGGQPVIGIEGLFDFGKAGWFSVLEVAEG